MDVLWLILSWLLLSPIAQPRSHHHPNWRTTESVSSDRERSGIQPATKCRPKLQPRCKEPVTKAHRSAASVADNEGRWV